MFDLTDLAELLVYRGINDPERFTRLERASIGAREQAAFTRSSSRPPQPAARQPTALPRPVRARRRAFGGNKPFPTRGQIDDESMALFTLSPRLQVTTVSGGVQSQPGSRAGGDKRGRRDDPPRRRPTAHSRARSRCSRSSRVRWRRARHPGPCAQGSSTLPATSLDDTRERMDPTASPSAFGYRTLNYGYNSGEQSLLIAGHMALNAASMVSGDGVRAATILLDESMRTQLNNEKNTPNSQAQQRVYHWWNTGGQLDPNEGDPINTKRLPNGGLTDERRQARNLFSVTAQPFLAEAAVLTVFTDAPVRPGRRRRLPVLERQSERPTAPRSGARPGGPGRPDDRPSTGPGGVDIHLDPEHHHQHLGAGVRALRRRRDAARTRPTPTSLSSSSPSS
ncbi:MAG: hypothetical protein R3B49_08640 [Phycisphaerales bacterium]